MNQDDRLQGPWRGQAVPMDQGLSASPRKRRLSCPIFMVDDGAMNGRRMTGATQ